MSEASLTRFQAGIESTPGTAVAATRIIYVKDPAMPFEEDNTVQYTQSRANYIANYDTAQTHRSAKWASTVDFSFDDIHFWLHMMAKGGVTPTGSGPYVWTYNGAASSDDLDTLTLEAADNVVAVEVPYMLCTDWEITGSDGNGPGIIEAKMNWLGQKVEATTMTPALSERNLAGTYGLFRNTSLYLDDTAGGLGGTVQANLMAFTFKVNNNIQANYPAGQNGLYTSHSRGKRYAEVTLDLLLDSAAYSEFTDHYLDGDARFARLRVDGAGNDVADIDFAVKRWNKYEPKRNGPTRRVVLMAQTAYDATLGYDWQIKVTNDESSL